MDWCMEVKRFWQVILIVCALSGPVSADEALPKIEWSLLKIANSAFPRQMGMMDNEREDYANHLAGIAVQRIREKKADAASLATARKMLALALHLSPKNKRAVVTNFRLGKGQLPDEVPNDLQAASFAKLLMQRGQLLEKQEGQGNAQVARYFFELAAELDPANEDAIYLAELRRISNGELDWEALMNPAPR